MSSAEAGYSFDQSSVIPYRKHEGKIEVLLITSMHRQRWIVPKGYIEFNLHPFESAKKEAYEEAGLVGTNETIEMGHYQVEKATGKLNVRVYSMEVIKTLEDYPEKKYRKRSWFPLEEAVKTIDIPEVAEMIKLLPSKIK